jgi:hypothetical protein
MVKFRIFMEFQGGDVDHIDLQGTTEDEVATQAIAEVERRKPVSYWSKQLEDAYGPVSLEDTNRG